MDKQNVDRPARKFIKQAFNINLNKVHAEPSSEIDRSQENSSFLISEKQYFVKKKFNESAKVVHNRRSHTLSPLKNIDEELYFKQEITLMINR